VNRIANEPESVAALAALKPNFRATPGGRLGSYKSAGPLAGLAMACLLACPPAHAQQAQPDQDAPAADQDKAEAAEEGGGDSATAIAKKLQNPVGDLINVPFQNNTNFGFGPHHGTQDDLNIQPVIPIHITSDWNIITRTILPLVWNPDLSPLRSVPFGTGPTDFSAFLSPHSPTNGWLWGLGPIVQLPTISGPALGSNVWGGGPTAAIVYSGGPWVVGALANNVWSFGGTKGPLGNSYNNFLVQPFVNYNLAHGWYLVSAPILTANWEVEGRKWTVPVGGGVGRVVKIGKLPVNFTVQAYYNLVEPRFGADWQLRSQVALIF